MILKSHEMSGINGATCNIGLVVSKYTEFEQLQLKKRIMIVKATEMLSMIAYV
jgi:hypothetical protein